MEIPQEEEALEKEALAKASDDEIRSKIIESYGLDEAEQADLIDRLVADKKEGQEKLTKAIGQKINWREKATAMPKADEKKQLELKGVSSEDAAKIVREQLEERDLEALDLSDEAKAELKSYVKASGVSVKKALDSQFGQFLKERDEKKKREIEASANKTNKTAAKVEFSKDNMPRPPLILEGAPGGKEAWEQYRKEKAEYDVEYAKTL